MTLDYDTSKELDTDELTTPTLPAVSETVEPDDGDIAEFFELPGADLSGEELTAPVVPRRSDEFVCDSCFLVHHHSRLARSDDGTTRCRDCS